MKSHNYIKDAWNTVSNHYRFVPNKNTLLALPLAMMISSGMGCATIPNVTQDRPSATQIYNAIEDKLYNHERDVIVHNYGPVTQIDKYNFSLPLDIEVKQLFGGPKGNIELIAPKSLMEELVEKYLPNTKEWEMEITPNKDSNRFDRLRIYNKGGVEDGYEAWLFTPKSNVSLQN